MTWIRIVGWVLFVLPLVGFTGFSFWMIKEAMADDDNIVAFVTLLGGIWFVGGVILALSYFTDFFTRAST